MRDGAGWTAADWEDARFYASYRPMRCMECGITGGHASGCPAAEDEDEEGQPVKEESNV